MHDLAFADSARPKPVACLRLLLKPYSLGHELLLWQQRNPLLISSREVFDALPASQQCLHLIRAVLVCYRDWSSNQLTERWLRIWHWANRNTDWPAAIAEFRNYMVEGRALLPTLSSEVPEDTEAFEIANEGEKLEGGRSLGSPFLAQLLQFASRENLHLKLDARDGWRKLFGKPATVYDVPFALAAGLFFTQLEDDGRMKIENFKEAETRATMVKMRADVKAEKDSARTAWLAMPPEATNEEKSEAIQQQPRIYDLFPEESAKVIWSANIGKSAEERLNLARKYPVIKELFANEINELVAEVMQLKPVS